MAALRLSKSQVEVSLYYMGAKMKEANVNSREPAAIINWVIHNPLPSIEDMEAFVAQQLIDDKAKRIAHHRAALAKLEGN
jgi:hypothetical protein